LAQIDPTALHNEEVAKAAGIVAAEAARAPKDKATADQVFDLLANAFGSDGLDTLYRLADSTAGDAAKRAMVLLRRTQVIERASPALRVTVELRDAPCEFKYDLFERAGKEGDARTLTLLTKLKKQPCRSAKDPCCYAANKELAAAITALERATKK
jgi:serine/threonine-protein kinase